MSGIERHDPSQLRISDDDRHKVSEFLRMAAGEGRLDLEELEERLEATYAAKTYGDLIPITADLPQRPVDAARTPVTRGHREVSPTSTSYSSSWVVMGETKRQGAWLVPEQHTAFALMGEVTLDLREATFGTQEVTINASAIMAQVTVIVDAYTRVVMQGFPLMGEFSQDADKVPAELGPDSPTVHVRGLALMGAVNVVGSPPRAPRSGTSAPFRPGRPAWPSRGLECPKRDQLAPQERGHARRKPLDTCFGGVVGHGCLRLLRRERREVSRWRLASDADWQSSGRAPRWR